MPNCSNNQPVECFLCGNMCDRVQIWPCLHDHICFVCVRRILDSKCPFCRGIIESVKTERGEQSYNQLQSKYLDDETRDLEKVQQISLVGPSARDNEAILQLLLQHSEKKYDDLE